MGVDTNRAVSEAVVLRTTLRMLGTFLLLLGVASLSGALPSLSFGQPGSPKSVSTIARTDPPEAVPRPALDDAASGDSMQSASSTADAEIEVAGSLTLDAVSVNDVAFDDQDLAVVNEDFDDQAEFNTSADQDELAG